MVVESNSNQTGRSRRSASGQKSATGKLSLELVDCWNVKWPAVLDAVRAAGLTHQLMLDKDGWLSARQSVIAAFDGENVVGQLAFRVEPVVDSAGSVVRDKGRVRFGAKLDFIAHEENANGQVVTQQLLALANDHARTLRCEPLDLSVL